MGIIWVGHGYNVGGSWNGLLGNGYNVGWSWAGLVGHGYSVDGSCHEQQEGRGR